MICSTFLDWAQQPRAFRRAFRLKGTVATFGFVGVTMIGAACSSPDLSGPTSSDPAQAAWSLSLSAHAITMDTAAPYNTLQLTAVLRTATGTALPSAPLPSFRSTDSSVRVSSTGLITALHARTGAKVVATLVYQGVRLSDTATVNVTAASSVPTFSQLQLALQLGDSPLVPVPTPFFNFFYGYDGSRLLNVGALNASNAPIPGSLVYLQSSDPLQGGILDANGTSVLSATAIPDNQVYLQLITTARVGTPLTIYASATVYGVTLQDSLRVQAALPMQSMYTVRKSTPVGSTTPVYTVGPSYEQVIGVGGYAWWINATPDLLDIVFDDPSEASPDLALGFLFADQGASGNISPYAGNEDIFASVFQITNSRQFLHAGRFHWHSPLTGVQGTVIVQ